MNIKKTLILFFTATFFGCHNIGDKENYLDHLNNYSIEILKISQTAKNDSSFQITNKNLSSNIKQIISNWGSIHRTINENKLSNSKYKQKFLNDYPVANRILVNNEELAQIFEVFYFKLLKSFRDEPKFNKNSFIDLSEDYLESIRQGKYITAIQYSSYSNIIHQTVENNNR